MRLPRCASRGQIQPNLRIHHRKRLDVLLHQDRNKVAIGTILGDGDRARLAPFGQISMEGDSKRFIHLGEGELTILPGESVGGIGSRLVAQLLFESWILRSPLKEIDIGTIQVAKGLLNGYRRDITKPGVFFLETRQYGGEGIIVELHTKLGIGSLAGVESPIVDEAAASERLRQDAPLFIGRREPIFVRPLRLAHCLFALSLLFDMLFQCCENLSIQRSVVLLCGFPYLFQQMCRKPDGKSFHVIFHVTTIPSYCNYVKQVGSLCPSPTKGTPLVSP